LRFSFKGDDDYDDSDDHDNDGNNRDDDDDVDTVDDDHLSLLLCTILESIYKAINPYLKR